MICADAIRYTSVHPLDLAVRGHPRGAAAAMPCVNGRYARREVVAVPCDDLGAFLLVRHEVQRQAHITPPGREKSILASRRCARRIFGGPAQVAEHEADLSRGPDSAWPWEPGHRCIDYTTPRPARLPAHLVARCPRVGAARRRGRVNWLMRRLASHEADHPADERPVVADGSRMSGSAAEQLLRRPPVVGELSLPPSLV